MSFYPTDYASMPLSTNHARQLAESGLDPGVARERGYQTVSRRTELLDFKKYQRRPGLLIPVGSPAGAASRRLRPDRPRKGKDGKPRKYEQPAETPNMLDVHPRNVAALGDAGVDLWVTEGEKKADCLTSRGLCTVALFGVWGWCVTGTHGQELLPCWDHIALSGRRVYIVFDADVVEKENVQLALERLVGMLEARDAEVLVVYLPGPEKGVDDYLVAGHAVNELKMLARKFDPEDIGWIRLSRDEKLRIALENLDRRFWAQEWRGMGGHTDRDVALKLIEAARRHGKVVDGGIRVTKAWGPLELEAKVSRRTLSKALARLEERGFLYRDNSGREPDKSGAFVLRANVNHYGESSASTGKVTQELQGYDPCGIHLRAPRLRWSRPKWKPSAKAIREHRLGTRRAPLPEPREKITRLGKIRGAILDALESAGGTASLKEIAVALHKKRPRDIRRRNLPMLEDSGIVTVSEDGNTVSLTEDWLEALEDQRELGMEIEADEVARRRYEKKKYAYHNRHKYAADEAPTEEEMDAARERRDKRHKEEQERPVSLLAAAIHDYLSKNSGDACQPAGWIGNTLWSDNLFPGKATPAEAKAAIEELGGERYLRDCLERHRTGAPPPPPKTIKEDAATPPPDTSPDTSPEEECKGHPLDCECEDCLIPEPRYARPYTNVAGAA